MRWGGVWGVKTSSGTIDIFPSTLEKLQNPSMRKAWSRLLYASVFHFSSFSSPAVFLERHLWHCMPFFPTFFLFSFSLGLGRFFISPINWKFFVFEWSELWGFDGEFVYDGKVHSDSFANASRSWTKDGHLNSLTACEFGCHNMRCYKSRGPGPPSCRLGVNLDLPVLQLFTVIVFALMPVVISDPNKYCESDFISSC